MVINVKITRCVSKSIHKYVICDYSCLDEARSLSQQQNLSLQKNCKIITGDPSNPVLNVSTKHDKNGNSSGKWKRERKYQHKTTVVASTCDSSLNDYKSSIRSNGKW